MKRLLVVAAHPDDEVLGCGGLIARTLRRGAKARVLVLTEGCSTQYPGRPEMLARKQQEARQAMQQLLIRLPASDEPGADLEQDARAEVSSVVWESAGLREMALHTLEAEAVVAPIQERIDSWKPDTVLVHHGGDLNSDHAVCHNAARVACRPNPDYAPRLLCYETLSSTEWGASPFTPNCFLPLTSQEIEAKINALRAYESEVRPWPHPRSPEGVEVLARRRGMQCGSHWAEAFQLVWERWAP